MLTEDEILGSIASPRLDTPLKRAKLSAACDVSFGK